MPFALSALLLVEVPQETGPNGEIYRELLTFVGLKGVQLEIRGVGGVTYNLRGLEENPDPEREFTGLSPTEREQLVATIKTETTEVLRLADIPLMKAGDANERSPRLVFTITTHRFRPDAISADVTLELMQAVRLRDLASVIWSSTWSAKQSNLLANSATLTSYLHRTSHDLLKEFVQLYVRAHRKVA
jgi:hypothetical protein